METFKDILKKEVVNIDAAIEDELNSLSAAVDPLLDEVLRYCLFNGGKRVRPLLVVLASRLCGKDDPTLYRLASAFEYLHVATLLHDDVIDRADTRRGKPTVNKVYDLVAAILAGDFLHAHSMKIVGELSGQQGLDAFCKATFDLVDGEFVQMRNVLQHDLSEEDYFIAIKGKTSSLIAASCEVGVVYGGGSDEQQGAMRTYGIHLGSAFQIIDDILDYAGDAAATGKAVGNDLVEGKITLPLIYTLQAASEEDKNTLLAVLEDELSRKNGFATVVELMKKYKALEKAKHKAAELIQQGLEGLKIFCNADPGAVVILEGLASYVLSRNK